MLFLLLILSVYSTPNVYTWGFYNQGTNCSVANFTQMWFIPIVQTGTDYVGCASEQDGYLYPGHNALYYLTDTTYGEKDCAPCGYELGNYCPSDSFTSTNIPIGSCHDNDNVHYSQYIGYEMSRKVELLSDKETFTIPDGWLLEIVYEIQGSCKKEAEICQLHPLKPYEDEDTLSEVYINAMIYKPEGNCEDVSGVGTCTVLSFPPCQSRYRACGDGSLVYPLYTGDNTNNGGLVDESGAASYPRILDAHFYSVNIIMLGFVIFCLYWLP